MNRVFLCVASCLIPALAFAQEGREDAIFGQDDDTPPITDEKLKEADDKLQLGGLMYMRMNANITDGTEIDSHFFSMPNLVDLYLDGRPSDRLRGFVRGRLLWNPTVNESDPLSQILGTEQTKILLSQLWLKFDLGRRLFITLGKQPVRWGATRIWNPVDVVNSTRRVPLELFDDRTGVPALKLHLPIESLGWNLYAVTLLDQADTLDKMGVAGRAEIVFGTAEFGLTGAWRKNVDPKAGIDLSAGIWDLDVTFEMGMTFDNDSPTLQISGGMEYAVKYSDEDAIYMGAEWFYNQAGQKETNALDLFTGKSQFFYSGRHYGAIFISLPNPGLWNNTTFAFSTVANLSDRSMLSRIDVIHRMLTFMTLQFYANVHYGRPGELNLGPDAMDETTRALVQALLYPNNPEKELTTPIAEVGLWLRIDL
jgi:hypothetical protein